MKAWSEFLIEGQLINLRPARESDIEAYVLYLQDEEMARLTGSHQEITREQAEAWLRKISVRHDDRVDFMIVTRDTDELVGEVVLNDWDDDNRSANIRIGIQGLRHRGKGYGTEAMELMLRYGFDTLMLHRIHLGVYVFNPRAVRVYEKLGFQHEGIERDALLWKGTYYDMLRMSILEDEYRNARR